MSRELPPGASLEHLRKQAKALLRAFRERHAGAVERFRALPGGSAALPRLADALHVLAREHGFASWPRLKAHLEARERDADPRAALVDAVRADDVARVRQLLARHPALRARLDAAMPGLPFGQTLLLAAVERGSRPMIALLLDQGARVDARSDWWAGGFGVLDSCAPDLAPFLVARGATVDAHAAARLDMRETLARLLAADPACVHARGADGQTPLHFAATIPVAQLLLDHGADVDARDVDHESTPAQWMVRDRADVARHLVARGCRTDVMLAAALGDLPRVRAHLDADPAAIHTRVTAEHFPMRDRHAGGHIYTWTLGASLSVHGVAHAFGHHDVVRLLLARSPEPLRLAEACAVGDEATVSALLAERPGLVAELPAAERRKVVDAADRGDVEVVRRLLAAGWPVDARGRHGATALHFAAWRGETEMTRAILRHAPPLEARSVDFDATPLGWAIHGSLHGRGDAGDYAGVVETLLAAGAALPPAAADVEASAPVRAVLRRHAAPAAP